MCRARSLELVTLSVRYLIVYLNWSISAAAHTTNARNNSYKASQRNIWPLAVWQQIIN